MKKPIALSLLCTLFLASMAQKPVQVGKGSYAEFPPLSGGRTDMHGGDQSVLMQSKKLWITEKPGRPIPTNDWWTGLINAPFADALWSYPAMVHPSSEGVTVNYPSYWIDNGTEMKARTFVTVAGYNFSAESAVAHDWSDWHVTMLMQNAEGDASMTTTLAHGIPMTWFEIENIDVKIKTSAEPQIFGRGAGRIGLKIGNDYYGLYYPASAAPSLSGNLLSLGEIPYVVVTLLPDAEHLDLWADIALNIPRQTTVSWSYDQQRAQITSYWQLETVNLATGAKNGDVVQGFVPHAYKNAVSAPSFIPQTYATPRGVMKMARGTRFAFTHTFDGILPWWPAPQADASSANPYRPEVMSKLINDYATQGSFGDDTYWGGKGLTQMALNMTFALETGNTDLYRLSHDKLKAKLINWLTYTPGETKNYFAYYPRWGGLVGRESSFDSDTFNDHHFHYGYFTLAGAMLCLVDEEFCANYGPMLREIAKDYANWDHADTRYPFLRTMDPWVGHSYAGGLGDQGNSNGNGQESSSESMQGWGGIYLLGVALNDKEMRDAGIFGWSMESRATREYWFDVDSRFPKNGQQGNYDYTLYKSPYNSNITCKGIGWWTWFGGDPLFMHGIQWMPASPALDYLSWDTDFVQWAYDNLTKGNPDWLHNWFDDTLDPGGNPIQMLSQNDWGNVTLTYLQRADPDAAAAIFDEALAQQRHIATQVSAAHISYYLIHSHRTYGDIDRECHGDIPTSNVYKKGDGTLTYVIYNPGEECDVHFYRSGTLERTVRVPKGKLIAVSDASVPTSVRIDSEQGLRFTGSSRITATVIDQYGATLDIPSASLSITKGAEYATLSADGTFTFNADTPIGTEVTLTAGFAPSYATDIIVTCARPSHMAQGSILPDVKYVETGNDITLSIDALDQYGAPYCATTLQWYDNGVLLEEPALNTGVIGKHVIVADDGIGTSLTRTYFVTPRLNLLSEGATAVSSSEENVGTLTANVNDGDPGTRWGSAHNDGEWVYLDLGGDCIITRVNLNWEAAYASAYDIEIAPDGATMIPFTANYLGVPTRVQVPEPAAWSVAYSETAHSSAGPAEHTLYGVGRYVRIVGKARALPYGISLFEMSVSGISANAADNTVIGIAIEADDDTVDENKTLQFSAKGITLSGDEIAVTPQWSTDNGTITADGMLTPATYGTANVTAKASGVASTRAVTVNEVLKLNALTLSPGEIDVADGESVAFSISGTNQFGGEAVLDDIKVSVDAPNPSGVSVDLANKRIYCHTPGTYVVTFTCGTLSQSLTINVKAITEINLALGKPVEISSTEYNVTLDGKFAVDGDTTTRWGSAHGTDNEWIAVDLLNIYKIFKIRVITNDAAYATESQIDYSVDGKTWHALTTRTMSQIGTDEIPVNDVDMRYIRYTGTKKAMPIYGIGVAELEAYGNHSVASSANIIDAETDTTVDVITLTGVVLRRGVPRTEAARGLKPGLYIIGGTKTAVL